MKLARKDILHLVLLARSAQRPLDFGSPSQLRTTAPAVCLKTYRLKEPSWILLHPKRRQADLSARDREPSWDRVDLKLAITALSTAKRNHRFHSLQTDYRPR